LSTCIFPDQIKYPIDETMLHLGPPHDSNNAYAYAKRMLDLLGRWYNERKSQTKFTCVIPTNLFGPNDNYHLEDAHVLPAFMHKLYIAQKKGADFVVYGTGKPLRQFLYSLDAGELMIWTMLNYEDSEPIILSVGEEDEISIGDAAKLIVEAFDFKGKMVVRIV
jgi:GDP-L-fucose synthase